MNPIEIFTSYPPTDLPLFFTGTPDFSDPVGRLMGLDASLPELAGFIADGTFLPF